MASILRVNTLTDASSNNSVAMSTVFGGSGKAWLQHNSSHTIQDSFNFASITDGGTGLTSDATFTSAMVNDDYAISGCAGATTNDDGFWALTAIATTDFNVRCRTHNGNLNDSNNASLVVHGDLA